MPDPTVRELTPDELELQTVDPANFPYVKQRGLLYWTGSAWAKWDGTVGTELPAATALADNTANPTVPGVGAYLMAYDGSTWDRATVSSNATPAIARQSVRSAIVGQTTTITSSTSETTIGTAVASTYLDLCSIMISNSSATAARVDIRDDTAGTIRFSIYVPAGDIRGITLNTPHPQTATNKNWTAQSSASVASLYIFCQFIKNT